MTGALRKMTFEVETELELTDDQKERVAAMVMGDGQVDHRGGYVDEVTGQTHQLSKVHFTCNPDMAVYGSDTTICGLDGMQLDKTVHVVLEDGAGNRTGLKAASGKIKASWHFGVLFEADGGVWFSGRDNVDGGSREGPQTTAASPTLRRVADSFTDRPGTEPMSLREHLPAEGEFWISDEDEPHVVSVPWWGSYADEPEAGDTYPGRSELRAAEQAELEGMVERVRALKADISPVM